MSWLWRCCCWRSRRWRSARWCRGRCWPARRQRGAGHARILVLSSPIHTDIAVPVDAVARPISAFLRDAGLPVDNPEARWMVFGWGGRPSTSATPTWSDISVGPLLKALTLDASVMHVEVARRDRRARIRPSPASTVSRGAASAGCSPSSGELSPRRKPARSMSRAPATATVDPFFEANGSFNALSAATPGRRRRCARPGLRTGWWNPLPQTLVYSLALYN